jgi:hypothetical protein
MMNEPRNENVVAGSSRNLFQDADPAFAWWDRGKPLKTSLWIVGVPAEI